MRPRAFVAALCLALGCAPHQRLARPDVLELSPRSWRAPTDEVFDATWLTLAEQRFEVAEVDRLAGTFVALRGGQAWEVEVSARGAEQRVVLAPRDGEVTRGELSALLDALEAGTRARLDAWRELPEWKFDGRRNVLAVPGFSASPPREWEWLDFDISRRHGVVQQRRARTGLNPTLLFDCERARPEPTLRQLLRRAAGLTVGARQRLVLPDELPARADPHGLHGAFIALDGAVPVELAWHALDAPLGLIDVQLVMVCPKRDAAECAVLWAEVVRSVVK